MSNADSRHSTRTTEGADLGLASQIHFFTPSLKLGHTRKAFLNSKPGVQPAMSHNEFTHSIGSCQLVWHGPPSFRAICLCCLHTFLRIQSNAHAGPILGWILVQNQPDFRRLGSVERSHILWVTTRASQNFKKSKASCSPFNLIPLTCYVGANNGLERRICLMYCSYLVAVPELKHRSADF